MSLVGWGRAEAFDGEWGRKEMLLGGSGVWTGIWKREGLSHVEAEGGICDVGQ